MSYSSLVRKPCKCGCGKMPTLGFKGFNMDCRPDLKAEIIEKQKRNNAAKMAGMKLRNLAADEPDIKAKNDYKSKSELLREADRMFADYIKARDTGKDGRIYCPCCKEYFRASDYEVNCMHFIDRDVYFLRFDEDAAHAGHGLCNKNQHYNPSGKEYQNFKKFLIDKMGENAVNEMELAKRKINKITEQQLKNVIEHYGALAKY